MQAEPQNIPPKRPGPRITSVFYWILLLVAVDAGFELFRVIQYGIKWQFLLTVVKPLELWLLINISFIVFAISLPILIGLIMRTEWAPVWCLRFLLVTSLVGFGRTIFFSSAPLDSTNWVSLGIQVLMAVILVVFLYTGNPRRIFYADID